MLLINKQFLTKIGGNNEFLITSFAISETGD